MQDLLDGKPQEAFSVSAEVHLKPVLLELHLFHQDPIPGTSEFAFHNKKDFVKDFHCP